LRSAQPDIVGLQEAQPAQIRFFESSLPELTAVTVEEAMHDETLIESVRRHYGVDLLPGEKRPNEVVLYYRTAAFQMMDQGRWWLSPTPEVMSVGFGNIAPRPLLWVKLRHISSGSVIVVANTHVDWRATLPMMEACKAHLDELVADDTPAVFMGGFNVGRSSSEYGLLISTGWRYADMGRDPRADSSASSAGQTSSGPEHMQPTPPDPQATRIDHILYRGESMVPLEWQRLTSPDPARRLSDHDPIFARLRVGEQSCSEL
jgi:endonuclease/exonuclease/phosphatase family metal-dependent hydrolase